MSDRWLSRRASYTLIDWLRRLEHSAGPRVAYSIGFDVNERVRAACNRRLEDWWAPCLSNTTGEVIDGLECCEITDLPREQLSGLTWATTMRIIVRRRKRYAHEQATGVRHQRLPLLGVRHQHPRTRPVRAAR